MKSMTIEQAEKLITPGGKWVMLDIRSQEEFLRSSYPEALSIPQRQFEEDPEGSISRLDRGKSYLVMCHTGDHSRDIVSLLQDHGIDAANLDGGWRAYLRLPFTKAVKDYQLIQEGDRIACCISGGKDSFLMAKLLQELQRHGPVRFELVFLCMNPGYNEDNWQIIKDNAKILGVDLTVFNTEIFDTVAEIDKNPCYLCARMRRGYLYSHAKELGCNKIALGHHYDDVIETILMGMLYAGKVETMMPRLKSQHFEGMELIRPLYLIREKDIKAWRDANELNFIQCACRFTENCLSCGGARGSKRDDVKQLIADLARQDPVIEANLFRSVENVSLNAVIGYKDREGVRHSFLEEF